MDVEGYRNAQTHFLMQFHAIITTGQYRVPGTVSSQSDKKCNKLLFKYFLVIVVK